MNRSSTCFCVVLLVMPAIAQRDRGPVLGSHLVGTVGPNTASTSGPLSQHRFYSKKAGFTPVSPPAVGTPDFRFLTLFPDPTQPDGVRHITLDAMSTGRDYIRADASGRIITTGNQWVAVLYSVRRRTGGTSSGVIAQEEAAADGAGADVFSKVYGAVPGGATGPLGLPRRVLDSTETDLYQTGQPGELLDFDVNMAAYELDSMITSRLPAPYLFFSVSAADAADVMKTPNAWWGGPSGPRSGATILYKKWLGTGWSAPAVAFTHTQLGLLATDDIDSVAVEDRSDLTPYTWDIVFSTTQTSARAPSQLMWARVTLGGPLAMAIAVYSDSSGVPVSDQLDLGDGNLDGACLYDPSFAQPGASNLLEGYIAGSPIGSLLPGTPPLDMAVWRTCPGGVKSHSALVTGGSTAANIVFHFVVYGTITSAGATVPIWDTLALNRFTVRSGNAPVTSDLTLLPPSVYPDLSPDVFVEHIPLEVDLAGFTVSGHGFPVMIRL